MGRMLLLKHGLTGVAWIGLALLCGCAAKTEHPPVAREEKTVVKAQEEKTAVEAREMIRLECNSANRLGCRHKGYLYPWNAWVELKGYKSTDYEVKDVLRSGNRATVMVVQR